MGWVHRQRRHGAYLALAALLLQIVVSFGHVDLGGIVGTRHLSIDASHKAFAAKTSQPAPAQSNDADDGYCAICASIFLVSSSFTSEAPPLPVPEGFERVRHLIGVSGSFFTPHRVVFRSRAPPTA